MKVNSYWRSGNWKKGLDWHESKQGSGRERDKYKTRTHKGHGNWGTREPRAKGT